MFICLKVLWPKLLLLDLSMIKELFEPNNYFVLPYALHKLNMGGTGFLSRDCETRSIASLNITLRSFHSCHNCANMLLISIIHRRLLLNSCQTTMRAKVQNQFKLVQKQLILLQRANVSENIQQELKINPQMLLKILGIIFKFSA